MNRSLIIIFIFNLYLITCVTAAGSTTLTQAQKCDLLDKTLGELLAKTMDENMLYDIMGYSLRLDAFLINNYQISSGLNFAKNPRDRHTFACKLADAKNRGDVAKVLGIPRWQVDNLYVTWTAPVLDVGGVRKLDDVAKVATLLFIWAQDSGYPILPLRNLNDAAFLKTFNAIHKVMMAKHVHDSLINAPFPLKVTPNRALAKLKSAKTYPELERGLFMAPGSLSSFARVVSEHPGLMRKGKEDITATMKFVNALDKTGILYFP